jgi:8-oxo-dGTP pyrophosphatase MutT (NUDIX family)
VLVREEPSGLEVLMVRRARGASFMGGVSVFPGGRVDDADSDEALLARCVGLSETEASERLGVAEGALGYYVAALRELFEESGVLLALEEDASPLVLEGERSARIAEQRRAVNRGELSFLDLLVAESLLLDLGGLRHHAHWITPEVEPKRFDTYFFVGAAPVGQEPLHDEGETTAAGWLRPAEALRLHRQGEIEIVLPTIRNLRYVERFERVDELLADAAALEEIEVIVPRMIMEPEGPMLLAPWEPGYLDGPENEWDASHFKDATRRRAAKENPPDA